MLNGACRKLLGILTADVRQQFDRELCHILSSNGTGQNSMLLLWCFGIVVLAEHPEYVYSPQDLGPRQLASTERQWKTASGRKLFGSISGLYKTINLTYLSVIWAAKGDVGVSDAEAIEGIRIAVKTLRFLDYEARESWPSSSALAKNIFPKLPAKIVRSGINPAVQLEALCFYAMIAGANNLPVEVVTQYECCLVALENLTDANSFHEILEVSLPIFASELESQNSYQRDSIVRSVAQICQDLETRCNTVEEPLRQEKARSRELEQRVGELSEQVSSLESQAADDRFHLDGLEDEKLGIADEKDRLSARFNELQVHLDEARRDADEALRTAQEEFNARELELRSTILNHEEKLRSREDDIQQLNSTVAQERDSLEHTEEELRALGERYENLQTRLGDVGRQLHDERDAKFRQSEEILRLKERGITLEHQLQSTESELETTTGQLSDLEVSHQELKQSSEDTLRKLEVSYSTDMEAAAARAEEEYNKLNKKLMDSLQNSRQLKDANDKTRRELRSLQNSFSTLETRAQELDILCGEQEEELEELRTLRKNVLASMGLATQNPLAIRSASRSQKDDTVTETPQDPRQHRRQKSAMRSHDLAPNSTTFQTLDGTDLDKDVEASFASSRDDSQNGSTPKRQKPRPSFKMPMMQTPSNQRPALASRSTSKKLSPVKRSALRQMSPNRRHTTVGFALSETEDQVQMQVADSARKRRGSLRGASQEDFDMDDFLAGTPLTPGAFASGTGRLPEDDGTTTEL
ncbi:hypothetical protein N0V95_001543 [Ascochyta clinopodiicola]|nr:hypothetical protein N0V95_001543 [Ascochyta clinopodiicola]